MTINFRDGNFKLFHGGLGLCSTSNETFQLKEKG